MPTMPTPLATFRSEPFGGYRHTLWLPLPNEADLDAAVGPLDPDTATLVEFETVSDRGWLMAVSVFTEGGTLAGNDRAALYGEAPRRGAEQHS